VFVGLSVAMLPLVYAGIAAGVLRLAPAGEGAAVPQPILGVALASVAYLVLSTAVIVQALALL
jgi:hypothetical protein